MRGKRPSDSISVFGETVNGLPENGISYRIRRKILDLLPSEKREEAELLISGKLNPDSSLIGSSSRENKS